MVPLPCMRFSSTPHTHSSLTHKSDCSDTFNALYCLQNVTSCYKQTEGDSCYVFLCWFLPSPGAVGSLDGQPSAANSTPVCLDLQAVAPGLRSHRAHLCCCCCFRKESKSSLCSSSWAETEAGALARADSEFSKVPSDWPTTPGVTQLPNFIHRVDVDASLFVALSPSDRRCV